MGLFGKKNDPLTSLSQEEKSELRIVLYDFASTIP